MFSKLVKSGVLTKLAAEAKKPENQEKAKAQAANLQEKYKTWKGKQNRA